MYIQSDLSIKCIQSDFLVEYTINMIIVFIWLIVIPMGLLTTFYKKKSELNNRENLMIYGFFYVEYNTKNYFWEIVKTYLKVMIVLFGLYEYVELRIRAVCIVIVFIIYILVLIRYRPYLQDTCNYLEFMNSLICSGIILF